MPLVILLACTGTDRISDDDDTTNGGGGDGGHLARGGNGDQIGAGGHGGSAGAGGGATGGNGLAGMSGQAGLGAGMSGQSGGQGGTVRNGGSAPTGGMVTTGGNTTGGNTAGGGGTAGTVTGGAGGTVSAGGQGGGQVRRVFFWDMETETPITSGDKTPDYYAKVSRSTKYAKDGAYSLETDNVWAAATFDNPTNNDVYAPTTQGTLEFDWMYKGPWEGKMLFQMTGKCTFDRNMCAGLDTNEGVALRMRGSDPGIFTFQSLRNSQAITLVDGKWYHFILKYRSNMAPYLSMQIDDKTWTGGTQPGATEAKAWHQLLIGNDHGNAYGVQYIDNFAVHSAWTP